MLRVIEKGREQEVIDLFKKYNLEAVSVGVVTDDKMLRFLHKGEVVAEVSADALAEDSPVYHKPSEEPAYYREFQAMEETVPAVENYEETLVQLLKQPTIASKEWVYRQFDHQVGNNTVVPPGSDAAVVRIEGTEKAIAISTDCNSRYIYLDPETGGKIAVAEAARNVVCSGAKPLALTDGLNFGSPEKPEVFWQMEKSADGISAACLALGSPVIGGNVSLFNEKGGKAIYPTPIIGMVGLITNLDYITTQSFKNAGDLIYLIGETREEFGGSELQKLVHGDIFGKAPSIDLEVERARQDQILEAIHGGFVASAHDVSEGGVAVALAESTFDTAGLGASVTLTGPETAALFSESQSRFILSVKKENQTAFEAIVADAVLIGKVTADSLLKVEGNNGAELIHVEVNKLEEAWRGAIPCLLKSKG